MGWGGQDHGRRRHAFPSFEVAALHAWDRKWSRREEGVRGRTDAGGVDGGQDVLASFYGSPQDEQ